MTSQELVSIIREEHNRRKTVPGVEGRQGGTENQPLFLGAYVIVMISWAGVRHVWLTGRVAAASLQLP